MSAQRQPEPLSELFARDTTPEPSWIEPKILPRCSKLLLGGLAKIGKSFVGLELARALASGTAPFECDKFSVPESCRVLFIEQELGPVTLRERTIDIFRDATPEMLATRLWYMSKVPSMQLSDSEGRIMLHDALVQVRPNVVFLDPINKFHTYEENDATGISKLWNYIDRLIDEFKDDGLSFILSHHFGKPARDPRAQSDPLDAYNFRGSSKWFDDADSLMTFERQGGLNLAWEAWQLRSRITLRHGSGFDDLTLTVNEANDRRVRFKEWVAG